MFSGSTILKALLAFSMLHVSPTFVIHYSELPLPGGLLPAFPQAKNKFYQFIQPMCTASDPANINTAVSIDKALKRRERLQSTPLSQRWYKLRQRQITPAQRKVLRELWPQYGVDLHHNTTLDLSKVGAPHHNKPPCKFRCGARIPPLGAAACNH